MQPHEVFSRVPALWIFRWIALLDAADEREHAETAKPGGPMFFDKGAREAHLLDMLKRGETIDNG